MTGAAQASRHGGGSDCPGASLASEPERIPAVGHDRLASDPARLVGREQEDAPCDVGGFGLAVDHLAAQAGIHDGLGIPSVIAVRVSDGSTALMVIPSSPSVADSARVKPMTPILLVR